MISVIKALIALFTTNNVIYEPSAHCKAAVSSDIDTNDVQGGSSASPAIRVRLLLRKCNFPSTTFGFRCFSSKRPLALQHRAPEAPPLSSS